MLLLPLPALALTLSLESERAPWPGVTLRAYRTSSPTTNTFVALVDLCAADIHVDATRASDSTESTGSWAADQGVRLATNGDFYKTGPLRVYGDAVGGGVRWPLEQTGVDAAYADEWYWEHYGWIAFGHDTVELSHTGWVKENVDGLTAGWGNDTARPTPPAGTLALVSGFPELVIEGERVDCSSPTADDCFPDRTDMRDRHPRTAMGLTEDRRTLILAVVDGRTDDSAGMYGEELASLMHQLGAWTAFNLDGGGSSQLWADGDYVNDVDGNNSGGGTRAVANHWGVYAGGTRLKPSRPGHCVTAEPCAVLPPEGGTLDDAGACFQAFGPERYWREEAAGEGGHLYSTNAWEDDAPYNWAWWRVHLADAGTYRVEAAIDPTWGVGDRVRYGVRAAGVDHEVIVDQGAAEGWTELGTFVFAAGGDQWIAVHDDTADASADEHVVADAVRLTRLDLPPEDTGTSGGADSAPGDAGTGDSGAPADGPPAAVVAGDGCGCAAGGGGGLAAALLALAALRRRPTPRPAPR